VARQRSQLYGAASEQLKKAFEGGFYIECVAICESIITDRLEARLQFLSRDTTKLAPVLPIGHVLKAIKKSALEKEPDLLAIYEKISMWGHDRNEVIHQFVKRTDIDKRLSGKDRTEFSKETAKTGIELKNQISSLVRKHNKWVTPKKPKKKAS
jgi:hypothetical protein